MTTTTDTYPFYLKKVEGSKKVQVGNYSIPPGVDVFPGLRYIMHDPKHWDMPWEFRPERFLDPETGNAVTNNPHFVPFQVSKKLLLTFHFQRIHKYIISSGWTTCLPCQGLCHGRLTRPASASSQGLQD